MTRLLGPTIVVGQALPRRLVHGPHTPACKCDQQQVPQGYHVQRDEQGNAGAQPCHANADPSQEAAAVHPVGYGSRDSSQ